VLRLSFALLLFPAGYVEAQSRSGKPGAKQPHSPTALAVKEGDEELKKLLIARHKEAVEEMEDIFKLSRDVRFSMDGISDASQRLIQSGLEIRDQPKDRVEFLKQHVELLIAIEKNMQGRLAGGAGRQRDLHRVRYCRLDAEIHLLRARRQAEEPKRK
jgi:hypothetical protein